MHKNFINQNENDEFIKFRGLDLQELLVSYYIGIRLSIWHSYIKELLSIKITFFKS